MKILFEDEYFFAIDKPAGLVVHSDGRTEEQTVVDWLVEYVGDSAEQSEIGNPHTLDSGRYSKRYGIVNRLDRETSGIILIAKDQDTFSSLQKQFLDRTVKKEYIAKVWGKIDTDKLLAEEKIFKTEGENFFKIIEPISRHKKDPRIWVCGNGVGERATKRDAETDFEILPPGKAGGYVRLYPKTGRTHQLRLHCRFLGHPIVGDVKYGISGITNEHSKDQIKKILTILTQQDLEEDRKSRLMLHAKSVELFHPKINKKILISSEIPFEFGIL